MTPVISPWVLYVLPVADTVWFVSGLLTVIGVAVVIGLTYTIYEEKTGYRPNEDRVKLLEKLKKKVTVLTIVLATLAVFVPSEETLTKMIIAQNVTYERVEVATDTVKTVYDDIMELFDKGDS